MDSLQIMLMRGRRILLAGGATLLVIGLIITTNADRILSLVASFIGTTLKKDSAIQIYFLGGEFLVYGIGMAVAGLVVLPRWRSLSRAALQHQQVVLGTTIAAIILLWLPAMLLGRSVVIDGERYWWLFDDAMISMRYARNAAAGVGLVWNPSEYVEGYTNFLWTICMALVHLLPIPSSKTALVILLINLALAIATLIVIVRLITVFNGGTFVTIATLVSYIINRNIMTWAIDGLETTLLTFLLLFSIYRLIQDVNNGQSTLTTNLLIALLSLVRTDAIIYSALLYLISILLHKKKRVQLFYTGLSLCLPLSHLLFRWFYYHDLIPNTAYLKVFNWEQRFISGLSYILSFIAQYSIFIGFALWFVFRSKQRIQIYLFSFFAIITLYIAYVGGDAFYNFRFFVPILPIIFMQAFLGIRSFTFEFLMNIVDYPERWGRIAKIWLVGAGCGVLSAALAASGRLSIGSWLLAMAIVIICCWILGSVAFSRWQSDVQTARDYRLQQTTLIGFLSLALCIGTMPLIVPGYTTFLFAESQWEANLVRIGVFLRQNTPPDSKVAATAAGSIFYFSERYGIDFLGKADRYIARLPVTSDGVVPGHNKFDYDYSLGVLKPDFVVADFAIPVSEEEMQREAKGNTAFIGQLYFHRIFQEHCFPYPIYVGMRTTVFQCRWSSADELSH